MHGVGDEREVGTSAKRTRIELKWNVWWRAAKTRVHRAQHVGELAEVGICSRVRDVEVERQLSRAVDLRSDTADHDEVDGRVGKREHRRDRVVLRPGRHL